MAKHVLAGFKNINFVSTTGSLPDNPTGQLAHPPSSQVVMNDQTAFKAMKGSDGFSARQPKANVKLTTPGKVS